MFGGDVHARAYAELQRTGISPQLGRIGLDAWARALAPIKFKLVAVAARTSKSALRTAKNFKRWGQKEPKAFFGDKPWLKILRDFPELDVMAVATPDHLHTAVILAALNAGAHVITEKPMCLAMAEADAIIALAKRRNRIVAVDMHKRYDPDHLRIRDDIKNRIGHPLYGVAYLEEPLEVSTRTFKWVEQSDPFSYVGPHWVDLFYHYYKSKPRSLTAVGQKKKLVRAGLNAYDAVQVRVDFENGMSINFHNNWITPPDFEGPVNQGHEIVGTEQRRWEPHGEQSLYPPGAASRWFAGLYRLWRGQHHGGPGGHLPNEIPGGKPRKRRGDLSDRRRSKNNRRHCPCRAAGARFEF